MRDETILKKAIEKAVKNGWENDSGGLFQMSLAYQTKTNSSFTDWLWNYNTYRVIIFSHNFSKAFWGEKKWAWYEGFEEWARVRKGSLEPTEKKHFIMPAWQYHLQQLVLCEKPLEYLEKFLEETK